MTVRRRHERRRIERAGGGATFSTFMPEDDEPSAFGALLVLNEDVVAPGQGFGMHPHQGVEILTIVVEGTLEHRDDMGRIALLPAGHVQRMNAGTGIWHSERNASLTEPLRFFQLWLAPSGPAREPEYEQQEFSVRGGPNGLLHLASRDSRDGCLSVSVDADVHEAVLTHGASLTHTIPAGRRAWIHVVDGSVAVNGVALDAGDGAAICGAPSVAIQAADGAQVLLLDLR